MILGIEMLVTVAVIGYFGYHYGSILLAGFKSAKASISSQTPRKTEIEISRSILTQKFQKINLL